MSFLLNRHCVCLWGVNVTSIPLHGVGITTALVVFERVGKRGGIATEREVIAGVWREHHLTAHVEAVQIALQRGGGHAYLVVLKVVTRREADIPPVADAQVAAHVDGLRELVGIAHLVVVELLEVAVFAHGDTIAHGERPGHGEEHVAIVVGGSLSGVLALLGSALSFYHVVVDIAFDAGVDAFLLFFAVFFVVTAVEEFAQFLWRERE